MERSYDPACIKNFLTFSSYIKWTKYILSLDGVDPHI